ncbi:MAG: esterase family protein, partial [Abditibacteriota bacterium]|nr:esterase family protein [Abditibacteriota bacterium]
MSCFNITFFSRALSKSSQMLVFKPDGRSPFPVVYQLHGQSDDYTQWARFTTLEQYAVDHQIMIVLPDGGKGYYTNAANGDRYEDHILETVEFIDNTFNTVRDRKMRGIGGLSMGGYGTLKLAMKHPDVFSSAAAHSSVIVPEERRGTPFWDNIFADFGPGETLRSLALKNGSLIDFRFDCGTEDGLLPENRAFAAFLKEKGIPHVYEEHPGTHNWDYWRAHVGAAIAF